MSDVVRVQPCSRRVGVNFFQARKPHPTALHRAQANGPVPLKKGSWFGVSPQWSNIRWCSRRRLAFKQLSHLVIAHAFQIPPSQHSSKALRVTHLAHAAQHLLPQPVGPPEVLSHVAHVVQPAQQ